ncbi:MAG: hypothetical protein KME31_16630 [Tolypothrix carrinoi HA7290-LM1]|nr:hypothetical protein [Tolypothrix carrinoi HA7290-LM1]
MTSAQPVLVQPNQFQLGGYDTEIVYASSITGVPQLTYKTRSQTLNFSGEQIQTEQTQLGQMVTVNLSNNPQAIGVVETLTLLIPTVNLTLDSRESFIQTIAIFSLRSPLVKKIGQSQTYMTLCLSGTAQQIDF